MMLMSKIRKILGERPFYKLSFQLNISFLLVFFIVTAAGFMAFYQGVIRILDNNSKNYSIRQIEQCEDNINNFCHNIDLASSQMIYSSNFGSLKGYSSTDQAEQLYNAAQVIGNLRSFLTQYAFVDSVVYYGSDGLILQSSIRGNNLVDSGYSKSDAFHTTKKFQDLMGSAQKMVWYGGLTDHDFASLFVNPFDPPTAYITVARKIIYNQSNMGVVVINMAQSYFASIYSHSYNVESGKIYLIDASGMIISATDESVVGTQCSAYPGLDESENIKTLNITVQNTSEQVTYYRLSNLNWILVSEIPTRVIMKDAVTLRNILIILYIGCLALAFALSKFWIYRLLNPLKKLTGAINQTKRGILGVTVKNSSKNEFGLLTERFNEMSLSVKELFAVQAEKRALEIETLKWQINPHFINNTLNVIKWIAIMNKEDNIAESLTSLASLIDPVFRNTDIMCAISDETEYIQDYIKIMNYRFAGGLECCFEIPEELMNYRILRFILQPVVENSILHGLMNKVKGKITISAWIENNDLTVGVEDNGAGINDDKLAEIRLALSEIVPSRKNSSVRVGLTNVNRRVKLQFGDCYGLQIQSQVGAGTTVLVKMPIILE